MAAKDVPERDFGEGEDWNHGFFRCAECNYHAVSAYPLGVDETALECPQCGEMKGCIVSEDEWKATRA